MQKREMKSGIKTYRDLTVWQKSMNLVEFIYHLSASMPADEKFTLTSQIRRAAVSIPANIAEGHARKHRKEYAHHLSIARGSLAELETHLTLAVRLKLLQRESVLTVWEQCQEVGKLLNKLISVLRECPDPRPQNPDP